MYYEAYNVSKCKPVISSNISYDGHYARMRKNSLSKNTKQVKYIKSVECTFLYIGTTILFHLYLKYDSRGRNVKNKVCVTYMFKYMHGIYVYGIFLIHVGQC